MPSRSCLPEPTVALGVDLAMQRINSVPTFGACTAPAIVPRTFRTGTLTMIAPHSSRASPAKMKIAAAVSPTDQRFTGPAHSGPRCVLGSRALLRAQPLLKAWTEIQNLTADPRHGRALAVFLPIDQGFLAVADLNGEIGTRDIVFQKIAHRHVSFRGTRRKIGANRWNLYGALNRVFWCWVSYRHALWISARPESQSVLVLPQKRLRREFRSLGLRADHNLQ